MRGIKKLAAVEKTLEFGAPLTNKCQYYFQTFFIIFSFEINLLWARIVTVRLSSQRMCSSQFQILAVLTRYTPIRMQSVVAAKKTETLCRNWYWLFNCQTKSNLDFRFSQQKTASVCINTLKSCLFLCAATFVLEKEFTKDNKNIAEGNNGSLI